MNRNKNDYPVINIGSASLLVIFLILCLVTFAALTLSGAVSDYRFSRKLADRQTAYYEANNRAQALLSEIDSLCASPEGWKQAESLSTDDIPVTLSEGPDFPVIRFSVPVNDTQDLAVALKLQPSADGGSSVCTVRQWQLVAATDWEGDNSLNLIQPSKGE